MAPCVLVGICTTYRCLHCWLVLALLIGVCAAPLALCLAGSQDLIGYCCGIRVNSPFACAVPTHEERGEGVMPACYGGTMWLTALALHERTPRLIAQAQCSHLTALAAIYKAPEKGSLP